jgi:predicted RNA binding protein with dsRBD fold (UPF0201 family)
MSATVSAESLVNPTEDPEKVERALHNIFPSARVARIGLGTDITRLEIRGDGFEFLNTLRSLIRQERIRSAARSILLKGTSASGNQIQFYLNKQAAFAGRVSFCAPMGESPLGPITIRVETSEINKVIDFLAAIPIQNTRQTDHDHDEM